jgi:hypothetical protein
LKELRQFLGLAEILGVDCTSAAVFAKILSRTDQPDKFFGIGFDKTLFLEGAQGFFTGIAHRFLLSNTNIAASGLHFSRNERMCIPINIHSSEPVKQALAGRKILPPFYSNINTRSSLRALNPAGRQLVRAKEDGLCRKHIPWNDGPPWCDAVRI